MSSVSPVEDHFINLCHESNLVHNELSVGLFYQIFRSDKRMGLAAGHFNVYYNEENTLTAVYFCKRAKNSSNCTPKSWVLCGAQWVNHKQYSESWKRPTVMHLITSHLGSGILWCKQNVINLTRLLIYWLLEQHLMSIKIWSQ